MAKIKAHMPHMAGTGKKVIAISNEMHEISDKMVSEVSNLNNVWKSDTATVVSTKFKTLSKSFDELQELTKKYGKSASEISEEYRRGDNEIEKSFSPLPENFGSGSAGGGAVGGGSISADNSSDNPFDIPGLKGKGAGAAADWFGYEVDDDKHGITGWIGRGSARAEGDLAFAGVNAYIGKAQAKWDADFSFMEKKKNKEYNKETGEWEEKDDLTFINAELGGGASVAVIAADGEAGVGTDGLGLEVKGDGAIGKATADGKGKFNVSEDGVDAYVKGELKASAAEGELKGTVNLGPFEVTGKVEGYAGSIGVEGEFGFKDNKFVAGGGAAALFGFGAGVEVGINNEFMDEMEEVVTDVKDGICDFAGDLADGVSNTVDNFMDWIGK